MMMVVMPMLRNYNHKKVSSSDFWGINIGLSEIKSGSGPSLQIWPHLEVAGV